MDYPNIANGFTIYWRIENFNWELRNKFTFDSLQFQIRSLNSNWRLVLSRDKGSKYLGMYMFKESNPINVTLNYYLSILTGSGWNAVSNSEASFEKDGDGYGYAEFVCLKDLKEKKWFYLPNGSLTISFHVWHSKLKNETSQCLMISRLMNLNNLHHRPILFFSGLKPNDLLSFAPSYDVPLGGIPASEKQKNKEFKTQLIQTDTHIKFEDTEELLRLFKEKEFSFITLQTSNRILTVHKAVLCAKSPVFNAMFELKMKENDCNSIDITDIEGETMESLIKFLHFQPIGELSGESAVNLYYAADKYQINALKKECVSFLKKELSVENVCDVFLLADLHQDEDLTSCAHDYFFKNSKVILLSKQWKDLLLRHTELASSILCKLAEKM